MGNKKEIKNIIEKGVNEGRRLVKGSIRVKKIGKLGMKIDRILGIESIDVEGDVEIEIVILDIINVEDEEEEIIIIKRIEGIKDESDVEIEKDVIFRKLIELIWEVNEK